MTLERNMIFNACLEWKIFAIKKGNLFIMKALLIHINHTEQYAEILLNVVQKVAVYC